MAHGTSTYNVIIAAVRDIPAGTKPAEALGRAIGIEPSVAAAILRKAPISLFRELDTDDVEFLRDHLVELSKVGIDFRVTTKPVESMPKVNWPAKPDLRRLFDTSRDTRAALSVVQRHAPTGPAARPEPAAAAAPTPTSASEPTATVSNGRSQAASAAHELQAPRAPQRHDLTCPCCRASLRVVVDDAGARIDSATPVAAVPSLDDDAARVPTPEARPFDTATEDEGPAVDHSHALAGAADVTEPSATSERTDSAKVENAAKASGDELPAEAIFDAPTPDEAFAFDLGGDLVDDLEGLTDDLSEALAEVTDSSSGDAPDAQAQDDAAAAEATAAFVATESEAGEPDDEAEEEEEELEPWTGSARDYRDPTLEVQKADAVFQGHGDEFSEDTDGLPDLSDLEDLPALDDEGPGLTAALANLDSVDRASDSLAEAIAAPDDGAESSRLAEVMPLDLKDDLGIDPDVAAPSFPPGNCTVFLTKIKPSDRDRAIGLFAEIVGMNRSEAARLMSRLLIPVLKGVSESAANDVLKKFQAHGFGGRVRKG